MDPQTETETVTLNDATALHRISGLEENSTYYVEVKATAEQSPCTNPSPAIATRSIITIRTETTDVTGGRSIENKQNEISNNIRVYPNPVADLLTVETPEALFQQVEIYDAHGQLRIRKQFMGGISTVKMDVSSLQAGGYFLKIQGFDKKVVSKVFVKTE